MNNIWITTRSYWSIECLPHALQQFQRLYNGTKNLFAYFTDDKEINREKRSHIVGYYVIYLTGQKYFRVEVAWTLLFRFMNWTLANRYMNYWGCSEFAKYESESVFSALSIAVKKHTVSCMTQWVKDGNQCSSWCLNECILVYFWQVFYYFSKHKCTYNYICFNWITEEVDGRA